MLYPLVDVLRAAAALLVLTYHVMALGSFQLLPDSLWGLPFRIGWIGVDLFLVISGFVITLSAAREQEKNPDAFRWSFMQRRLRRIVPLYVLTCVVFIFMVRPELFLMAPLHLAGMVLSHALFLQNLSPYTHGVINGVTWSLALEMQFYVALILCIGVLLRLGALRSHLLLVGIAWAWRYGTTFFLKPGEAISHMQVIYTTELPGTLDAFAMGITMALVVFKGQGFAANRMKRGWGNFAMWITTAAVCFWVAAAIFLPRGSYWSFPEMIIFWRTLLAMGFGAALGAAITCPLRGGGLLRPVRYLGQISYGMYLWHLPVLTTLLVQPDLRGARLYVIVLTGAILLSSISWHWLEKPWLKGKNLSTAG
jgi:peptidoglycan/LPS O-acetylase OafA/YrhL